MFGFLLGSYKRAKHILVSVNKKVLPTDVC